MINKAKLINALKWAAVLLASSGNANALRALPEFSASDGTGTSGQPVEILISLNTHGNAVGAVEVFFPAGFAITDMERLGQASGANVVDQPDVYPSTSPNYGLLAPSTLNGSGQILKAHLRIPYGTSAGIHTYTALIRAFDLNGAEYTGQQAVAFSVTTDDTYFYSGYQVAAGGERTCALTSSGVVCWGARNWYGENNVPAGLVNPRQLAAGSMHTCALDDNGISCWGSDWSGESTVPSGLVNPWQIAAGGGHTCAIDNNGVTCWGANWAGQSTVPTGLVNPRQVTTGYNHTCALDDNGVTCWGSNSDWWGGYIGQSMAPAGLTNPRQITAGAMHTCALDDNGVTCWGGNSDPWTGLYIGQSTPPPSLVNPRQITAGVMHTCALDDNGITCWGADWADQSTVPAGLEKALQITAGYAHTCALDIYRITCWGNEYSGVSSVPPLSFAYTDTDSDRTLDFLDLDDDNDGIPDSYENQHAFLDPLNPSDAALDQDGDGLTNLQEHQKGTDPTKEDTDRDGLSDKYELDNDLDPTDGICPAWVCGGGKGWRHAIPSIK